MRALALVTVVLGCGGSAPSQVPARPPPKPVADELRLPPTVAKLFEHGRKWTFPTKIVTQTFDSGNAIEATASGTLACAVVRTGGKPGRWTSVLECQATPQLPLEFPMKLVATPVGLWEDQDNVELDPAARLIAEPPRERNDRDEQQAGYYSDSVTKRGGRWCFRRAAQTAGSGWGYTVCLRDGDFVGGSVQRNTGDYHGVSWGDVD